jgi:transcriptional regulator with XRE-family HTH domain
MGAQDIYLGEKIRQLRVINHVSQEELGRELGMTKQVISRIEKGIRQVRYTELEQIAKFLDEPIETFTKIDLKYKLVHTKFRTNDIPEFAIEFLNEFDLYLRSGISDDLGMIVKEELKRRLDDTYSKVFSFFSRR